MSNEEQLAIRDALGKAQGWERIPASKGYPASYVNEKGEWVCWADTWNPLRHADDLLALLEWARKQKWFQGLEIEGKSLELLRWNNIVFTEAGPLQEALPVAIYRAL